jgi:hypothetical protein
VRSDLCDEPSAKLVIAVDRADSELVIVRAAQSLVHAVGVDQALSYVVLVWNGVFDPFFQVFAVVVDESCGVLRLMGLR